MNIDHTSTKNDTINDKLGDIQKKIDSELLRKSIYDGGAGIDMDTITSLENDLNQLNSQQMSIDTKVQVKKLQLRLNSYRNNLTVMKVARESETIGLESLQALKIQSEQLHRIDSGVDHVDAQLDRSHQIIKEMQKRRRRMYFIWTGVAILLILVAIIAILLTIKRF